MSTARDIPYDETAERALLGAAMLSSQATGACVNETEPEDFWLPVHQLVRRAIGRLWEAGLLAPDPVMVRDEIVSMEGPTISGPGGSPLVDLLLVLQAETPGSANAHRYATIVVEYATLRHLIDAGGQISALGYSYPEDVSAALDTARTLIGTIDLPTGVSEPSMHVDDFLAVEEHYDWVCPGLIEVSDRTIITGGEGGGKSTLLRQMAVALASGIHPFTYVPFEMSCGRPPRVLIVDVENSANQIRRKLRPLRDIDGVHRSLVPQNLRIESKTEGIDLTNRHDARWLIERVASNRPDVMIIGPIYKLHAKDPNDEQPAREVTRVLDLIRSRYRCALLIEAHSPHASPGGIRPLRPIGASLWLRWPEFGYGLRPDKVDHTKWHFEPWRGARDAREWPRALHRGVSVWPWTAPEPSGAQHDPYGRDEPPSDYQDEEPF